MAHSLFAVTQERAISEALRCQANTDAGNCPACGDPTDECPGHYATDDHAVCIIRAHENDDHSLCYYSI
jgi:hypothetical protein